MATKGLQRTLDRLRRAVTPELADECLLKNFVSEGDEAAFTALVRRHGQMVLGVARRILGNLHDSEDVFQAAFLVLAQKARSVIKQGAVASWLYKVAYRIALKAKSRNYRRRQREAQVDVTRHPETSAPVIQDWEVLLDEELTRLPEKYRLPLLLCDLEGRTRKEVERQLRLAPGTLSSRLTTARRRLAEKLARRGLSLSAGALATCLSASTVSACVPPGLVGATVKGAKLIAAGKLAAISSSITILMKAGAKAMFLAKLKATVATLMVVAVLGGGLAYSGSGGGQGQPKNELEALRRENELLNVNLRVTLEKIEALEHQVKDLKGLVSQRDTAVTAQKLADMRRLYADNISAAQRLADINAKKAEAVAAEVDRADKAKAIERMRNRELEAAAEADRAAKAEHRVKRTLRNRQLDAALDALQKAQASQDNKDARQKALDALEKALKKLRDAEPKNH